MSSQPTEQDLFTTTLSDYQQSTRRVQDDAATFLTFMLGSEEYAVDIERVLEIVSDLPITFVPGSTAAVLGVVNIRGRVVPVLSLRRRFDMADHPEHILILIEGQHGTMAMALDRVQDVARIREEVLEAPPQHGMPIHTAYIQSIAKDGNHIRIILDVDKVLDLSDLDEPSEAGIG